MVLSDFASTCLYYYDALYQPLAIDAPTGDAQYLYDAEPAVARSTG